MKENQVDRNREVDAPDANPDPITGAPGSHPVGTGIGAAGGGLAGVAAGFAIGAAASGPAAPVGGVIGAVVGAVAGGLAGKGVAESVNPTAEDAYWRENYMNRPYFENGYTYDEYAPAYRYGWESHSKHEGRKFDEVESDLGREWDRVRGSSSLGWDKAKHAARDAWHRVERAIRGDLGKDGR